jgi:hypothetical protein
MNKQYCSLQTGLLADLRTMKEPKSEAANLTSHKLKMSKPTQLLASA